MSEGAVLNDRTSEVGLNDEMSEGVRERRLERVEGVWMNEPRVNNVLNSATVNELRWMVEPVGTLN